jgi:quercetin dioxygenase-like cupin family protein
MVARLDFAVGSAADFAQLRRRFSGLPMQPKVLLTREGGTDISSPGRQSLSLLVGEETAGALYVTDVYLSPGFGAPPHHQPTEEELWYLLEGELDVRVAARPARLKPGSFAFIPRNTTHTFKNNGTSLVRLLAWNSPAGHERAFEEMGRKAREGVTAFPQLREIFRAHEIVLHADERESASNDVPGGALAAKLVAANAHGRPASKDGVDARILLDRRESGGVFEVGDVRMQPGASLQSREELAETCVYVTRGAGSLAIDGHEQQVGAGAFAFVPRGHALSITGSGAEPLHFVTWTTRRAA